MNVQTDILGRQVRRLIEDHKSLERNGKLLFAGWYDRGNSSGDVNLFEVFEDFPDPGVGKLETFLFPSSRDFAIRGSLRLTVTSPTELRTAAAQNDPVLAQILASADREVVYPRGADWEEEIKRLTR